MSTDLPEGNDHPRGTTSGRTPRLGDARSPVGSTLSIVLAVVAVIAGFLILRELTDDDGGDTTALGGDNTVVVGDSTATGDAGVTSTTNSLGATPVATTTTAPSRTLEGATIAVANASGVSGSAAGMSSALTTAGYVGVAEPGNGTGADQETSSVYFVAGDAAAEAVARSIAADLGGVEVAQMPAERPVSGGDTGTATVVVMLGSDAAGKSLSELSGADAVADDTTSG